MVVVNLETSLQWNIFIKNLLDNTEVATIFLDKDLCIKRFTPKATELINLISTDVGRPINHIVSNLYYEKLVDDAKTVLKTLEPMTTEGIDKNGHCYAIRIIPYRTINNLIDGVVITFLNIHAQKQAESKVGLLEKDLTVLKDFNHTLLNTMTNPTIILDNNETIILANHPFLQKFNIRNEEIMGESLYKIDLKWNKNSLKNLIKQLLQEESLVKVSEVEISPGKTVRATAYKVASSTILLTLNKI